jgi:serine/threonine protein kinase/cytoskeletal protein RodZ
MAVETAESFLETLKKSKLLKSDQLAVAGEIAGQSSDARALARALVQKELLTRWQASQLLAGRTGFFWGKYKFVDKLGQGGMGSVFLAWHTMMNRAVALKIISRELGQDPAALERFFTEARAVAALDHPNIVHAYDVANESDRYFMVMEYVEGRDLQRMVEKQGPLEFPQAVDYIRQAAEGLAHAHSKDMIHCDIKPANLLVNQQGVVKILDMGMARAVGRKAQADASAGGSSDDQAVLGTVDYMAPEQGLGLDKADRRSDVYSLGCTFYFLVTGKPPFPSGTLAERIVKHQTEEPKDIVEQRPDAPPELVRICRKMMAKEPADRFQTADEVARVLAEWHPSQTKILRATPLEEGEQPVEESAATAAKKSSVQGKPAKKPPAKVPVTERLIARAKQFVDYVKADRRRMMIWGGSGGTVLVLLLVGLMWWMVATVKAAKQQARDLEVAQKAAAQKAATEKAAKEGEFGDLVPAWERNEPEKTDAEKAGTEKADGVKAGAVGPPPKPGGPPPKPGAPPPPPGALTAAPTAEKTAMPEPKAAATPPGPAAATSPPEAKAAPAPAPAPAKPAETPEKKAEKTPEKPAEKAAPAAAPPAKPATPQPAAPAGPADAFAGFPPFLELPPTGEAGAGEFAAGPTLLAKVQGPPDTPISIELLGKETALKGKRQQFSFEQKEREDKNPGWVVRLPGKEDEQIEIAQLWRDKDGLKFRWGENAAKASGDYLRNCALELQGGGPPHVAALREPAVVEPIVFDLQKGISIGNVAVEFLPDPANVRVELTKVLGETGPLKLEHLEGPIFKPNATMTTKPPIKNPTILSFGRKDLRGHEMRGVDFSVTAMPKGKGLAITIRLEFPPAAKYKSDLQQLSFTRNELELKVRGLPQQFAGAKEEGQKADIAKRYEEASAPLWYEAFYQQVHRKARLHFRVFIEAKDKQIELARTEPLK